MSCSISGVEETGGSLSSRDGAIPALELTTMSPMSTSEDERARQALLRAATKALRGPQERWDRAYRADENTPAAPGTILRIPDALLRRYDIDPPVSIVVLNGDAHEVRVVPIRLTERAGPGEILVEEARSPFLTGFCLVAWSPFRLPVDALAQFEVMARATAVLEPYIASAIGTALLPDGASPTLEKWKRLVDGLQGARP